MLLGPYGDESFEAVAGSPVPRRSTPKPRVDPSLHPLRIFGVARGRGKPRGNGWVGFGGLYFDHVARVLLGSCLRFWFLSWESLKKPLVDWYTCVSCSRGSLDPGLVGSTPRWIHPGRTFSVKRGSPCSGIARLQVSSSRKGILGCNVLPSKWFCKNVIDIFIYAYIQSHYIHKHGHAHLQMHMRIHVRAYAYTGWGLIRVGVELA